MLLEGATSQDRGDDNAHDAKIFSSRGKGQPGVQRRFARKHEQTQAGSRQFLGCRRVSDPLHLSDPSAVGAADEELGHAFAGALLAGHFDGRLPGGAGGTFGPERTELVACGDFPAAEWQGEYERWQKRDLSARNRRPCAANGSRDAEYSISAGSPSARFQRHSRNSGSTSEWRSRAGPYRAREKIAFN